MIPRGRLAAALALFALVAGGGTACGPTAPRERSAAAERATVEDVVLVTIDTLRADHLGAYGYPRDTSPFLDSLAARGALFTRAIATCSQTAPSHASIFTALHPFEHGLLENGQPLRPQPATLAELFAGRGFETAAFISVGFLDELRRGFATFSGVDPRATKRYDFRFRPASETVDAALAWLTDPGRRGRSFVWIHLFDVHEAGRPTVAADPALLEPLRRQLAGDAQRDYLEVHHGIARPQVDLELIDAYDAQLRHVDRELERLYAALARAGKGRGALWAVTADHGEGLWSHALRGHSRHIYQEQVRVPLILAFADAPFPPARIDAMVSHVDLLPTFAELLDAPAPATAAAGGIAGRSLLPLLRGAPGSRRYALSQRRPGLERKDPHWEAGNVFALQSAELKLIHHPRERDELYDLVRDPVEAVNRIDDPDLAADPLRKAAGTLERLLPQDPSAEPQVDPRHLEELRALGYL